MGPSPKAKTTLTFLQQSAMGSSSTYQSAFSSQPIWTPRRRSLAHLLVSLLVFCLAFEAFRLWTFSRDSALSRVAYKRHDLTDEIANEAGRVLNTTSKVFQDIKDDLHPGEDVVEIVAQKAHDELQKCGEPSCSIDLSVLEKKFKAMHDDFLKTRNDGVTDEDWKKQQIEVVIPAFVKELKEDNGTSSSTSTATGQVASTLVTLHVTKTEVVPGPTGVGATPTRVKRDDGRADAFDRQNSETNSGTPPSKRDDFGSGTIDNALQKRAQPASATPIPIIPLDNKLREETRKFPHRVR